MVHKKKEKERLTSNYLDHFHVDPGAEQKVSLWGSDSLDRVKNIQHFFWETWCQKEFYHHHQPKGFIPCGWYIGFKVLVSFQGWLAWSTTDSSLCVNKIHQTLLLSYISVHLLPSSRQPGRRHLLSWCPSPSPDFIHNMCNLSSISLIALPLMCLQSEFTGDISASSSHQCANVHLSHKIHIKKSSDLDLNGQFRCYRYMLWNWWFALWERQNYTE